MSKLPNAIYEIVRQIREAFPSVTLMYEYIADSDTHFFKAMPFAISSSRGFKEFTADLRLQLMKSGVDLAVGFLSEDSLTQLSDCAVRFEPTSQFQSHLQKFLNENFTYHTSDHDATFGPSQFGNARDSGNYALAA